MTMTPIMSAALATLRDHQIARGSTLMNIIQQAAGSIGTAVMSVVLANQVLANQNATIYGGVIQDAIPADQVPPQVLDAGRSAYADAFGHTYIVSLVLVVLCLVPAFFLPRKPIVNDTPMVTTTH